MSTTIGLFQPGEMGAEIAGALTAAGHQVVWASAGRGAQTIARAEAAGLSDLGSIDAVVEASSVILSICPPGIAHQTAEAIGAFSGIYVDANALAPASSQAIADVVRRRGADYVDGGIVGRPPIAKGDVRLYLSGPSAPTVAALFDGTALDTAVIGPSLTAASAMKTACSAWTKTIVGLVIAVRDYAAAEGIEDALVAEWARSWPYLEAQHAAALKSADLKGWRWTDEMRETAKAFDADGVPGGFAAAAAQIYSSRSRPA